MAILVACAKPGKQVDATAVLTACEWRRLGMRPPRVARWGKRSQRLTLSAGVHGVWKGRRRRGLDPWDAGNGGGDDRLEVGDE